MALKMGIIQINVTDLNRAWSFYVNTLGIRGVWRLGSGKPFELDLGPGPTVLVYRVHAVAQRRYPDDTSVILVFYTDDIVSTVATWRSKGVSFIPIAWADTHEGIAPTPFGRFIAFRDPFGNVHELLEPS